MGKIRKLITRCILDFSEGGLAPAFGTWERDGIVIINCANQQSVDWLKSQSTELNIDGHTLHVLPAEELPKRHLIVVHVEEPDLVVEKTIKLLDRQNIDLNARGWVVLRESESRDAKSAHFAAMIDGASLEILKICEF